MKKLHNILIISMLCHFILTSSFGQSTLIEPNATNGILSKNGSTVATAPSSFIPTTLGSGTRLMWMPAKSSFRVGTVTGTQWDATNIGTWSFAAGYNAIAYGDFSTAFGFSTAAIGNYATAIGNSTVANGNWSTAMGAFTSATGDYTFALGKNTTAQAYGSLVLGRFNKTAGTMASWINTDPVFVIGNGATANDKNNALTVFKNGDFVAENSNTLSTDPGIVSLPVTGAGTRMMWLPAKSAFRVGTVLTSDNSVWNAANIGTWSFASGVGTQASGVSSTAMGDQTTASGFRSTAFGFNTFASNSYSTVFGNATHASGEYSTAMGESTTAQGANATSMGFATNATGAYSTAMGEFTEAQAYASLVIGQYNIISGTPNSWINTEPVFVIGNGNFGTLSNAFSVFKNGKVEAAGTITASAFVNASDIRYKKNIRSLENSLANLLKIKGIRYDWRQDEFPEKQFSNKNQIGFIAQEIEQVFPEMVYTDEKGYKSVDYARLTPVLVEAIKELTLKNEKLERRLEKIESLILKTSTKNTVLNDK